ncbi:HlyD family efflux transporter periplasmic adaptor subunit [Chryseolinea sp. T2]|uniref:HlyD family secretion protein n=1 Tax=Chryseolinea sp. T2 TaxID=3129255 RepID=UPI0030772421
MDPRDATRISLAVYLDRHTTRYPIYLMLAVVTIVVISVLPFLKVEVSVGSPGIMRPVTSVTPIKAFSSGIVTEVRARENLRVGKGDALISVHSAELSDRQQKATARWTEVTDLLKDVDELATRIHGDNRLMWFKWKPVTALYQQLLGEFGQRYRDAVLQAEQSRREHRRSRTLFESGVIAASEMEQADEALRKNEEAVSRLVNTHMTEWQQTKLKYENELTELKTIIEEAKHAVEQNQIVAPVSGTIHQLIGLYPGSNIFSGQEIGYISPDTTLIAEVHVAPDDIGNIRKGLTVRLQIATYNYNEWGFLTGVVTDVSDDVVAIKDDIHYIVTCRLSREYLQLRNGNKGPVKKGMTLHARFVIGRRSIWQLLYNKTDDWLNPVSR